MGPSQGQGHGVGRPRKTDGRRCSAGAGQLHHNHPAGHDSSLPRSLCIRQEFWNADTGEIICNMTAAYGDEKYGSTKNVFNEADYITILPCIYGYQPGLQTPFNLTAETNITAIKYFNNTHRHLGQMAQWTGLMVYDTDPY